MKLLNLSNAVAYFGLIAVNLLSIRGNLGPSNAEVSAKYQTLVTPSGSTFSIWGVIFLLQMVAVILQALPIGRSSRRDETVNAISYYWIAGWTSQCAWQFAFVREAKTLCAALLLAAFISFLIPSVRLLRLEKSSRQAPLRCVCQCPTCKESKCCSCEDCNGKCCSGRCKCCSTCACSNDQTKTEGSGQCCVCDCCGTCPNCHCPPCLEGSKFDALFRRVHTVGTVMNTAWLSAAATIGVLIVPIANHIKVSEAVSALSLLPALVIALLFSHHLLSVTYPMTLLWALWGISVQSPSNLVVQTANAGAVVMLFSATYAVVRRMRSPGQTAQPEDAKPLLS